MKSMKFLDDLMKAQNLKNDAELARFMEWPTSKISQYRTGKRMMDNEACLAIALKLGIDPMRVIMAADIDRAERAGQHSLWEVFTSRMATAASVALFGTVTFFVTPENAEAASRLASSPAQSQGLYIMLNMDGSRTLINGDALMPPDRNPGCAPPEPAPSAVRG